ncbi:hypothetical protein [Bradyrhizobium sp. USDA 336]|uniref:hypothetical protein n=1 Tax=Bradyrhizobium sp. USDA 336 TaxID=3156311 RepID=UPI003838BC8A
MLERLERNDAITLETIALFIRFWLTSTPALPEQNIPAARAKGAERYDRFVELWDDGFPAAPPFFKKSVWNQATQRVLPQSQANPVHVDRDDPFSSCAGIQARSLVGSVVVVPPFLSNYSPIHTERGCCGRIRAVMAASFK